MTQLSDYDLLGLQPHTMADPYPFYDKLLAEAPVYQEPRHGVFIVSRYDDIVEIKRHPERFTNRQPTGPIVMPNPDGLPEEIRTRLLQIMAEATAAGGYGSAGRGPVATLLGADPPVHTRYRQMTAKLLNPRRAKEWEPRIRAIADELVDRFIDNGRLEWVMDFAHPLPLRTVAEVLGVPQGDDKLLAEMFGGAHAGEAIGNPDIAARRMIESADASARRPARDTFLGFFTDRIRELRKAPKEGDFLSDLIAMTDPDGVKLNDEEILNILGHFQVAGHETSTKMMTQAMYQLLMRPEDMAAVRADPALGENLLEEALRYEAPVQGLFQIAKEDVEVGGVTIPEGAMLMTLYAAANRDPRHFPNPNEFDIRRANARTHLAFGQGVHFCIGSPLARAEGRHGFQAFFERTRNVRFGEGNSFERTVSYVLRGIREMHVEFDKA